MFQITSKSKSTTRAKTIYEWIDGVQLYLYFEIAAFFSLIILPSEKARQFQNKHSSGIRRILSF